MVTQWIFASGMSAKRYGGPGAFVVVFPLNGKYSARRSVLMERSGGFFAMEMRGAILALNGIRRGQEAEIGTFCNHLVGYVGRKVNRSWRDSHDVGQEPRDVLRGAISRYEEVSAVTYRHSEGLPEPLRFLIVLGRWLDWYPPGQNRAVSGALSMKGE